MTNPWLWLVPFFSAIIGWMIHKLFLRLLFHPKKPRKILGFTLHGLFPSRREAIAEQLGRYAGEKLLAFGDIERRITDPKNLEKIMPEVEKHIDEFLRVKLPKEMPMISVFIGDKTIASLKKIFMQELATLFPQVMKNYAGALKSELNLEEKVKQKLASLDPDKVEASLRRVLSRQFGYFELAGAIIGLLTGSLQLLLTLVITR